MKRKALLWITACMLLIALFAYNMPTDRSWSGWSLPLSGKVIVIDAGHGGPDGGASSSGGVVEKNVTLPLSMYLRDFLQQAGAVVIMTRDGDYDLANPDTKGWSRRKAEDLKKRVQMVNEKNADMLISIHLNAIPSKQWTGAQTFYAPRVKDSGQIATLVQEEIKRVLQNTNRAAKKTNDIYILRMLERPAVLVEVGFLSNDKEAQLMNTEKYQKQMANAIYQGILRYSSGERVPDVQ